MISQNKILQDPPFCVQIELTEGCNLFCNFCGINGIRNGPNDFKFMEEDLAERIAKQISHSGWNPRIEFAMHGEPLLNPNVNMIVSIFHKWLPKQQLMMTTNGITLQKKPRKEVNSLFVAGLNLLAIDDYGQKWVKEIQSQVDGYYYPYDEDATPHKRWNSGSKKVIYIQDIRTAQKGGHSKLINHCGCANRPLRKPLLKRCAKPFREISIRWDGKVAICCNDFRGHYYCGDVSLTPIHEVWQSKYFVTARKLLYNWDRSFYPCSICDSQSYRVGCLPDKLGKKDLPKPTERVRQIAKEALELGPCTTPILRPWEGG